jgi:hypothetical protein
VKLSGAHRISRSAPNYLDAPPFHQALVFENPDRLVTNPARLYGFAD